MNSVQFPLNSSAWAVCASALSDARIKSDFWYFFSIAIFDLAGMANEPEIAIVAGFFSRILSYILRSFDFLHLTQ